MDVYVSILSNRGNSRQIDSQMRAWEISPVGLHPTVDPDVFQEGFTEG
jgi:hypothetical protein